MSVPQHIADELSKATTALGDAEYHLRKFHETIPDLDEDGWEKVGRLLDIVEEAWGKAQDAENTCDELNLAEPLCCNARNGDLKCILSKGHTKPVDHWNGTFSFMTQETK